ncbi:MAG: NAD-dependent epimerase/dehydratase family protein [Pseudomonadota bacterium]
MERALVTGGGGFLGKAIVRKLKDRGDSVISFSRQFYPDLDAMGVEQIQGDLADAGAVLGAAAGVDTVYHVAAKAGVWGDFDSYFRANVLGTENVIRACLESRVPRLVYTSSPSVVFDGTDMEGVDETVPYPEKYHAPYPRTKAMAEKLVIGASARGLLTVSLRPHLIWGPGDNHLVPGIIRRAKRLKRVGKGRNRVDTIYVDNAAEAHVLAADALKKNPSLSGNVYFISQDEPVLLWDMVNAFLQAAGLPPVRGAVSARTAWMAGRIMETAYACLGINAEPPMTGFVARELATSHWFDISRAKKDLGYVPGISTSQGLENLRVWLDARREK